MHSSRRLMRATRSVAVALVVLSLIGCATARKPGFPKQSVDEATEIAKLEESFKLVDKLSKYDFGNETKKDRNEIINQKLVLMDLQYNRFVSEFAFEKQTIDTVTDVVVLGLSIGATAVGGAGAKTLLSAISAGVTGSKLSVDKNFYYEKTVSVLVSAMNAQRKTALIPILQGMLQSVDQYPLGRALADLDAYYRAGTFLGALQAIQADAGAKEAKASEKLDDVRATSFLDDASGRALLKFWMPNWILGTTDPEKLKKDAANQKKLRDWLDGNDLKQVTIQDLVRGDKFAETRKKVVKDLNIPPAE